MTEGEEAFVKPLHPHMRGQLVQGNASEAGLSVESAFEKTGLLEYTPKSIIGVVNDCSYKASFNVLSLQRMSASDMRDLLW